MTSEPLLHRLRDDCSPSDEQRARVRARMENRIHIPSLVEQAMREAQPTDVQQGALWNRVLNRIEVPAVSTLLDRLRDILSPSDTQQSLLRLRLMPRLIPVQVSSSYRISKWAAAFVLVIVALRASPVLFLAPRTVADSAVIVMPTAGSVMIASHGFWQSLTEEVSLSEGVRLKTDDGQATITLHDDGNVRLAADTVVAMNDVTNRPEPTLEGPTLTLDSGEVWVQGLLPTHLRGISIATSHGTITINAGSVSIAAGETVIVRVWDRHVEVSYDGTETTVFAGEQVALGRDNTLRVRAINEKEYQDAWVTQNLQRDAVHQREIAQMQQERRAAAAGILPTSPLYPMKRVAEKVDVLLTLDPEAKVQKKLDQASTRLNEAAALIAGGQSGTTLLAEYKEALIAVATGSGDTTQRLVQQEIAMNTADLSAALPDEEFYALKKTVLEASAELPLDGIDVVDVQATLIVDTLDVLKEAIAAGDTARAEETYAAIAPYLATLQDEDGLQPDTKKEVLTLLADAATQLQEATPENMPPSALAVELAPYLPEPETPEFVPLTVEQRKAIVTKIISDVYAYKLKRSRWNTLVNALRDLEDHPDAGAIYRELYLALPDDSELTPFVRTAIQELREEKEGR